MEHLKIKELTGLSLAYLGDAVWDLELRKKFIIKDVKVHKLNLMVRKYVNAKKQSEIYRSLEGELEGMELEVARRAKNSKIGSFPKTCTQSEYREATAFEALIALYYLTSNQEKIEEIIQNFVD